MYLITTQTNRGNSGVVDEKSICKRDICLESKHKYFQGIKSYRQLFLRYKSLYNAQYGYTFYEEIFRLQKKWKIFLSFTKFL